MQPYITPDFILDYHDGIFELSLNGANVPDLKVNRRYVEMIRNMMTKDGKPTSSSDRETIQFVKNKPTPPNGSFPPSNSVTTR